MRGIQTLCKFEQVRRQLTTMASEVFRTVAVQAITSAGYPEPVQVISECGASYKSTYYINYLIMRPGPRGINHALPVECAVDDLV